jgi:hypothetical protein
MDCQVLSLPSSGFVEHLSRTLVAQQSVTKYIAMIVISLVTPQAVGSFCSTNRPQADMNVMQQGALTEGKGSLQLISSLRWFAL